MYSYFIRVAQIKEQLEVIKENVEEGYIFMTTLNRLPKLWDSFIQGRCVISKLISFSGILEECIQEEDQLITREENMGEIKYQAVTTLTRKKENHHHNYREDHHHKRQKKFRKYPSNIRCYTYDEKGHYSGNYPKNKGFLNNELNKKIHHAHTIEDDEPTNERFREEKEDSSIDEEYLL